MKIIDLLNKIANGEEVPIRIRCNCVLYLYDKVLKKYLTLEEEELTTFNDLNDEVEIIEDTPIIG